MKNRPPLYYSLDHDEKTGIYTAYCPSMKPVRFSSRDKAEVLTLLREGVELYLKEYPDFFKTYERLEV